MKSRPALSLNRLASKSPPYRSSRNEINGSRPDVFAVSVRGYGSRIARAAAFRNIFPKNRSSLLTARCSGLISQSRRKRAPKLFGVVLVLFGTANWNSILSRHDAQPFATADRLRIMVGARIEFFDARKKRSNRWFFEIYIQGSKYNFLELSLNLN